MAADLTDLNNLEQKLTESEVSFSRPTLILAECVLVYIDQAEWRPLIGPDLSRYCALIGGYASSPMP